MTLGTAFGIVAEVDLDGSDVELDGSDDELLDMDCDFVMAARLINRTIL